MEESTSLSRLFAEQGLKIRIRKEIRSKRRNSRRRELVEQVAARAGSDPCTSNDHHNQHDRNDEIEDAATDYGMASAASHLNRSQPHVPDAPPSRSIVLPRNILDTHARAYIPFHHSYAKPSLPFSTTSESGATKSNIFYDAYTVSDLPRDTASSKADLPNLIDRSDSKNRYQEQDYRSSLGSYNEYRPPIDAWTHHIPEQPSRRYSNQSRNSTDDAFTSSETSKRMRNMNN